MLKIFSFELLSCVCSMTIHPGRPWVGRVADLLPNNKLSVNWFCREGRSRKFKLLIDSEGKNNCSVIELSMIMFWSMSENRSDTEFSLSNYYLETISEEYKNIDSQRLQS